MNREQMVAKAARALADDLGTTVGFEDENAARVVLDAILPQVTTVAELEALNPQCVVMSLRGETARVQDLIADDLPGQMLPPLTVVWTPEVTA